MVIWQVISPWHFPDFFRSSGLADPRSWLPIGNILAFNKDLEINVRYPVPSEWQIGGCLTTIFNCKVELIWALRFIGDGPLRLLGGVGQTIGIVCFSLCGQKRSCNTFYNMYWSLWCRCFLNYFHFFSQCPVSNDIFESFNVLWYY